jgi:hypothetical protein
MPAPEFRRAARASIAFAALPAILSLPCCGPPAGGTPHSGSADYEPNALTLRNSSEAPILAWSFDGAPSLPNHARGELARFELGAGPIDRSWFLRAAFDEGLGQQTAVDRRDSTSAFELPNGAGWVAGRYAHALSLERDTAALALGEDLGATRDACWTIECWVRPSAKAEGAGGMIAHWQGGGLLELMPDGRVRGLACSGREAHSSAALRFEQWNHLALVHDPLELEVLRIALNGKVNVNYLRSRPPATSSLEGLALGGPRGRSTFSGALDEFVVYTRALSSAQLGERALGLPRPGEHVLRIEHAAEQRELRLFSPLASSSELATQADFERGELEHAAWIEGALQAVPGNWSRDEVDLRPLARTTHAQAYIGQHRVLVFSGELRDALVPPMRNLADTWIYDLRARRWERLATDPTPAGRCHQMMAYSPDHELVLLHGGWVNDLDNNELLADTWVFHTRELRWEQRYPSGNLPGAVADAGLVYDSRRKCFLLTRNTDLYTYDPLADHWERLPAPLVLSQRGKVDRFAGRGSACFAYDDVNGAMLVFGGSVDVSGERVFSDRTALYSSDNHVVVLTDGGRAPSPRVRAAVAADPQRQQFLLFGGVRDQFGPRYDDLWRFRTEGTSWSWEPLLAANTPSVRGGYYGLVHEPELDIFALVCGRHDPDTFLDEVWRLSVRPGAVGRATHAFRTETLAWPLALELEWLEAPGSTLRAQLRSFAPERQGEWTDDPGQLRAEDGPLVQLRLELGPGPDGSSPRVLRAALASQAPSSASAAEPPARPSAAASAAPRFALRRELRGAGR